MPNVTMYTSQGMDTTTDNRWTPSDNGVAKLNSADIAAMTDITALDTALAAANGTYWTTFRLNSESLWDKLYWLRVTRRGTTALT